MQQQSTEWSTIVGIAEDVHLPGAHNAVVDYQVYTMPVRRMPDVNFSVRFMSVPPNVESVLRQAVRRVNPKLSARRARVADDYVREALAPTRFTLALLGTFAFIALLLSIVGLYGSIAYTVTQRTREIGIRIALGATSRAIATLVIGDGAQLLGLGLMLGIATALGSTRALTSLLYGVSSVDPMTFVGIASLVVVITTMATLAPARRAARIDPVDALRAD